MQTPALVIGHQYDLIHPFSDAGMLVSELPNGRLLEASSLIELRVAPRRLTDEIAAFVEQCWRPRAARRARPRVLIGKPAATLTPRYVESPRGKGAPQARAPGTRGRREGVRRPTQAHADGLRRRARRAWPSSRSSWSVVVRRSAAATTARPRSPRAPRPSRPSRSPTSRRPRRPRAASSWTPPNEGAGHEEKDFKASDYKQNPPTSGNHFPQWYQDGVYDAGRHAGARQARPHARARPHRRPVQAGHARRRPSRSSRRS